MKIQVIVGSNRPGRVSDRVGKYVAAEAAKLDDVKAEIVDVADYELPMFDEAMSPQFNPERKPNQVAQKWLDKIAEADGYVLIAAEYNRSYAPVLKNALDYVDFQMKRKPVALVAHGSTGGAQAVGHLRGVLPGVQAITTANAAYITGRVGEMFDENGRLDESVSGPEAAIETSLDELVWYAAALKAAR